MFGCSYSPTGREGNTDGRNRKSRLHRRDGAASGHAHAPSPDGRATAFLRRCEPDQVRRVLSQPNCGSNPQQDAPLDNSKMSPYYARRNWRMFPNKYPLDRSWRTFAKFAFQPPRSAPVWAWTITNGRRWHHAHRKWHILCASLAPYLLLGCTRHPSSKGRGLLFPHPRPLPLHFVH
jgi:hypothetical protein